MKKALWSLFGFFCIANCFAQTKRLTKQIAGIPFDYADYQLHYNLNASLGISINIVQDTVPVAVIAKSEITKNGITIKAGEAYITKVSDTIPLVTNTLPNKFVFDIKGTIGSFTIIKYWAFDTEGYTSYFNYLKNNRYYSALNVSIYKFTFSGAQGRKDGDSASIKVKATLDYYLVKTSELNERSEEFIYKKGAWNVGAMFLPVKLRPTASKSGFFDFTNDLSIGTTLAWTLYQNLQNDYTWNLLIYVGVSSVKVDSAMANYSALKDVDTTNYKSLSTTFKEPQNITAFSPAAGIYYERKGIQIGIVVGMDFLARNVQKTWVYRGMPWVGLAAGVSIFKITNNTATPTQNSQK